MKYILVDQIKTGDYFTKEFGAEEEAIRQGEADFNNLSEYDKKRRESFYVIESVNPNEEAVDHLDGDIIKNGYDKMEDKKMTKEKEIEILLVDGYTKSEAEKCLSCGTVIWENPNEYINNLKESGCWAGETVEDMKTHKIANISYVEFEGHCYYIEYVG